MDGTLEAAARAWAIGPDAEGRHQAPDRWHEDDDPLAHGLLQRLSDRRRLRGRGQRVRFPRRQWHLLRQGRRDHPPLAAVAHQGRRLGLPARLEWAVVRLDRRRAARRTLAGIGQGRGRVRDRSATGYGQPPGVEIRHADRRHEHDDRPGSHPALRRRLHVRQDPAASGDGHAHELRRGNDPGDRRRDSRPLQRIVPVRCARHRGRQRHQGCCLDAQGCDPRCRQHGSPEPERRRRPVRPDPGESGGQIPESPAYGRRHAGAGRPRSGDRPEAVLPARPVSRTESGFPERLHDRCPRNGSHAGKERRQAKLSEKRCPDPGSHRRN